MIHVTAAIDRTASGPQWDSHWRRASAIGSNESGIVSSVSRNERTIAGAAVVSAASSLPETVVTTAEIEQRLGLESGWIRRRTGIDRRHRAKPDETLTHFGAEAANGALI